MATDDRLTKSVTLIKDLHPGMKRVTCVFIVIDKGSTNNTKDGSVVRKCRVADKSASVCLSLWNEQAAAIEGGDILKLTKGYTALWKGSMVLYSGKYGQLDKIGEFNMVYSETPDMSDSNQQRGQQAPPPPPNPPGGRNLDPRGASLGPGNGRIGTGPSSSSSMSGNWNGNNHLSNGHREAPPPPVAGHMIHEPNHQGNGYYPHSQPKTPPLALEHSSHYRGAPSQHHPNRTHNERFHPFQRPPLANHNPDPWR